MSPQSESRNAVIWFVIGIIGLAMCVAPFVLAIEVDKGGGALFFFGVLLSIIGILIGFMYRNRAAVLSNMFTKENFLGHWKNEQHSEDDEEIREAYLSTEGVLCDDTLYPFDGMESSFENIELDVANDPPKRMTLFLRVKGGRHKLSISIPIQPEDKERAYQAVDTLKKKYVR